MSADWRFVLREIYILAVVTNCPPETGGTSAKRGGGGLKGERRDNYNQLLFSRKDRRERKVLFTFRIPRWRWSGRKLRYDKSAQRVLSTPSPFGYYPCFRGRVSYNRWVHAIQFAFAVSVARSQRLLQRQRSLLWKFCDLCALCVR